MIRTEYKWKSYDGLAYYACSWTLKNNPIAVICLVHGIGEHCSRYEDWIIRFVNSGYHVLSFDYRGHGKSEGKRGHTPSYDSFMNDVELLLKKSQEIFPGIPLILYGHSMGGNLVLNYVLRKNPEIKGIIVTSPWIRLAFEPPAFKVFLAKIMKGIFPGLIQSTGLKTKDLTRNDLVVDKYEKDELVHGKISVRTFFEVYNAGYWLLDHADEIKTPLLLMHGSADGISSSKASIEFKENGNDKITLKIWDGFFHELHNEAENELVFKYIKNWLENEIQN
jgi:alpha-beta hydrolase superfamily lysophospholipase